MLDVIEVREKNGFKFAVVRGTPADHASWWSFDDEQEVRDRWWKPGRDDVVLDIGAAFGSYALPSLAAGARVIAFSPADFDTELLEKNLELNPELARRCLVVREGLHEQDGWFDPDCNRFHQFRSAMVDAHLDDGKGLKIAQVLRVRALDSFLAERPGIDRVDWVKLDVEGAELGVLRGAEQCLRRWRPKLLIECHNFHDPQMERKVIDFLARLQLGYKVSGPVPHCAVSHAFFEVLT